MLEKVWKGRGRVYNCDFFLSWGGCGDLGTMVGFVASLGPVRSVGVSSSKSGIFGERGVNSRGGVKAQRSNVTIRMIQLPNPFKKNEKKEETPSPPKQTPSAAPKGGFNLFQKKEKSEDAVEEALYVTELQPGDAGYGKVRG